MTQTPVHNHASGAAEAPQTAPDLKATEIARWSKRARDLRIGLRNLTELEHQGVNCATRRAMLGAKLAKVEARIFRLRQGRLI
jgi:hypothetical protein